MESLKTIHHQSTALFVCNIQFATQQGMHKVYLEGMRIPVYFPRAWDLGMSESIYTPRLNKLHSLLHCTKEILK